jgi:hypothetical protein
VVRECVASDKGRLCRDKDDKLSRLRGKSRRRRGISCGDPPAAAGSGIARCRRWSAALNRTLARSESTSAMSAGHPFCCLPPGWTRRIPTVPANPKSLCSIVQSPAIWKHFSRGSKNGSGTFPQFVEREMRAFLECGVLACGFLRLKCQSCGKDKLLPLSCTGRAVCPSCCGRRMADTAAHLVDRVFPHVPVRQWVLSLPFALRYRLAYDGCSPLFYL